MLHKYSNPLSRNRLLTEYGVLLLIVLVPVSGLFRIDLVHGQFLVVGKGVRFSEFMVMMPGYAMLFSLVALFYTLFGLSFCGWVCPQNTFSELGTRLTKRLGGSAAQMGMMKESELIKKSKGNVNRGGLFLTALLLYPISMALAYLPLLYFFDPADLKRHLLSGYHYEPIVRFNVMYFFISTAFWLNFTFIRHTWCKYFCHYAILQLWFKTLRTLRISFDLGREPECSNCNLCGRSCLLDIDPRTKEETSHCTNCGECITACKEYTEKKGIKPLLKYAYGEVPFDYDDKKERSKLLKSLSVRVPALMVLLFGTWFAYGLGTIQPIEVWVARAMSVSKAQAQTAVSAEHFTVRVINKESIDRKLLLHVAGEGIKKENYVLGSSLLHLSPHSQKLVTLDIITKDIPLKKGLYPFMVTVSPAYRDGIIEHAPPLASARFNYHISHPCCQQD